MPKKSTSRKKVSPKKVRLEELLSKAFTDPASPLAYVGLKPFVEGVHQLYGVDKAFARTWLKRQRVYTKQRPAPKRRRERPDPTYVTGINEIYHADLLDISQFAKENYGVRVLLNVVDVLSRSAFVRPLQNKTPAAVISAFTGILKMDDLEALHTDRGKKFYNSSMAQWLKKRNIRHFSTHGDHKATIVERFNRTIKQSIIDYMIFTRQTRYVDKLKDFVQAYHSHHLESVQSLQQTLWQVHKRLIPKSYYGWWTETFYKVHRIVKTIGNPRYIIAELDGTPLQGRFYADELQKVNYDPEQEFVVVKSVVKLYRRCS